MASGRRAAPARRTAPATRYIESSALLAAFLEADVAARRALRARGRRLTSALTLAEAHRALVRARLAERLSADEERRAVRGLATFARRCELVAVTDEVLARAGRPFPVEPLRTLDAIHLASVELLDGAPQLIAVVTRDRRVAENARAMGYAVE